MSRKAHQIMEFRYYDIPQKEPVMALLGDPWVRVYGEGIFFLHFHNLMEIGLCHEGYGILTLDDKDRPYEPGMVSVIPRNFPHTTNSEAGKTSFWEYLFLDPVSLVHQLYPENDYYCSRLLSLINARPIFGSREEYPQIAEMAWEIMEEMRKQDRFYVEAARGLTNALLFEIARINGLEAEENGKETGEFEGRKDGISAISHALDYVSQHFRDPIRIEDLAEECAMSETHFRRLFMESMNMNPVDYINMVRIQRACELMKKSNDSIADIAMNCGFQTPSTFHRNFKQFIGITPYQWKKDPKNYESKLLKFHISAEKGW